ncbi:uncharacterized protein LOC131878092 [Tigriopus californicus]|uniref:uncharacterized protein LOC131878092 n=1 Tax=Tigriopus californicus TaxID=6832 RepID=UPI0027DA4272|nr:uncharacterized protein LOC131878092 [Tigriopus californicus]
MTAVEKSFYVDDLLLSVDSVEEAGTLLNDIKTICNRGRFNLTEITANNREVLNSLSTSELAKDIREMDFANEDLPVERALGVAWRVELDVFGFKIREPDGSPNSRRGLLSSVYAIYDPFGFIGPAILPAKRILQELCRRKCNWDTEIPDDLKTIWIRWGGELNLLSSYEVPRWNGESGEGDRGELHVFCDGSEIGYGAAAYVRVKNAGGIRCTLTLAKSRLAPLKKISIPRLELAGAKLAVELASIIKRER